MPFSAMKGQICMPRGKSPILLTLLPKKNEREAILSMSAKKNGLRRGKKKRNAKCTNFQSSSSGYCYTKLVPFIWKGFFGSEREAEMHLFSGMFLLSSFFALLVCKLCLLEIPVAS